MLDLGSGGGIDVLLSARRVGPTGKAYGLDMTDEMLELARANQREAGVDNVEFLKGTIEEIPLPDDSVDVVISNCVINLSADKPAVLREAARVLRPGGRFAVTDVVADADMDEATRADMAAWTGCIAGALTAATTSAARSRRRASRKSRSSETHRVHDTPARRSSAPGCRAPDKPRSCSLCSRAAAPLAGGLDNGLEGRVELEPAGERIGARGFADDAPDRLATLDLDLELDPDLHRHGPIVAIAPTPRIGCPT